MSMMVNVDGNHWTLDPNDLRDITPTQEGVMEYIEETTGLITLYPRKALEMVGEGNSVFDALAAAYYETSMCNMVRICEFDKSKYDEYLDDKLRLDTKFGDPILEPLAVSDNDHFTLAVYDYAMVMIFDKSEGKVVVSRFD